MEPLQQRMRLWINFGTPASGNSIHRSPRTLSKQVDRASSETSRVKVGVITDGQSVFLLASLVAGSNVDDWRPVPVTENVEDMRRCPARDCDQQGCTWYTANHTIERHTDQWSPTLCILCPIHHHLKDVNTRRRHMISLMEANLFLICVSVSSQLPSLLETRFDATHTL